MENHRHDADRPSSAPELMRHQATTAQGQVTAQTLDPHGDLEAIAEAALMEIAAVCFGTLTSEEDVEELLAWGGGTPDDLWNTAVSSTRALYVPDPWRTWLDDMLTSLRANPRPSPLTVGELALICRKVFAALQPY